MYRIIFTAIILIFSTPFVVAASKCGNTESIGARIYIAELHAISVTDRDTRFLLFHNDRDEVYVRVVGWTPAGKVDARLPNTSHSDDYYTFNTGNIANRIGSWRNQDGAAVFHPEIWEGVLAKDGDRAEFLVTVVDQDNAGSGDAQNELNKLFDGCSTVAEGYADGAANSGESTGASTIVRDLCDVGSAAAELLPGNDLHDLIGSFMVRVENSNGELITHFLAADPNELQLGISTRATTRILTTDNGEPYLAGLGDEFRKGAALRMKQEGEDAFGEYELVVVAEQLCSNEINGKKHRFAADDIERGTCRGGKQVHVLLNNNKRKALSVGETIIMRSGMGGHKKDYWCAGTRERELRGNFKQRYPRYVVERTQDKVNYYPFTQEIYTTGGQIAFPAVIEEGLRKEVASVSADLFQRPGQRRVAWAPTKGRELNVCIVKKGDACECKGPCRKEKVLKFTNEKFEEIPRSAYRFTLEKPERVVIEYEYHNEYPSSYSCQKTEIQLAIDNKKDREIKTTERCGGGNRKYAFRWEKELARGDHVVSFYGRTKYQNQGPPKNVKVRTEGIKVGLLSSTLVTREPLRGKAGSGYLRRPGDKTVELRNREKQ